MRENGFRIYFQFGERSATNRKKNGKIQKKISLLYLLKKNPERKNFDITFSLKRSPHKPRKINETMNPIFGLGHEIYELKLKKPRNFFEKNRSFFGRKSKASYLMTVTLLVQKVAYIYAVLLERERFLYLLSVLRKMSLEWEKFFRKILCPLFCLKTPSMKKI